MWPQIEMVAADTNTSRGFLARWRYWRYQPPGSGGGRIAGPRIQPRPPALVCSSAAGRYIYVDISTIHISTLDISILHNVMNNGYGCIWTRVRVLSVLTAGDPGLVRVRLASTSHQRRPGVLPASVPPRPPRRAQRSSSGGKFGQWSEEEQQEKKERRGPDIASSKQ